MYTHEKCGVAEMQTLAKHWFIVGHVIWYLNGWASVRSVMIVTPSKHEAIIQCYYMVKLECVLFSRKHNAVC